MASNLGGLVDPTSSHFLYSLLTAIDIFNIWVLILTGIGYSYVTRLKRATCMGVVFGWWVVVTLVGISIGGRSSGDLRIGRMIHAEFCRGIKKQPRRTNALSKLGYTSAAAGLW